MSNEKHTPGAVTVARIILNGNRTIETSYGEKNAQGIADMIDRETAAPELLNSLLYLVGLAEQAMSEANRDGAEYDIGADLAEARAAIAKAEGANVKS